MSALKRYSMDSTGRPFPDDRGSWVFAEDALATALLSEQVAALTKRLDSITGCVREELVRRAVEATRDALVKVAVKRGSYWPTNSDLRAGADTVAAAVRDADLSKLVPGVTALLHGTGGAAGGAETRTLVQQLADANAEIARLKAGAP